MELTHYLLTHPFNIHLDQVSHPEAGDGTFLRNTATNNAHFAMQKPKIQKSIMNLIFIFVH